MCVQVVVVSTWLTATRAAVWNSSAVVTVSWSAVHAVPRCRRASTMLSASTFCPTTFCVTVDEVSAAPYVRSSTTPMVMSVPGHPVPWGPRVALPNTTTAQASSVYVQPGGRDLAVNTPDLLASPQSTRRCPSSSTRQHSPSHSWYVLC